MTLPKVHPEVDQRAPMTLYGGLALLTAFVATFKVREEINDSLSLFKRWLPYSEADHVLALTVNLYVGGTCLEDQAELQQSEAVCRMLGACRLPDPTTAGDFLRRFDQQGPQSVAALTGVVDRLEEKVWDRLARRRARGRKMALATVDLDGHIAANDSTTKQGADFAYDGRWGFQPRVISLAETGEVLALVNRPANGRSSDGVAEQLDLVLPRLKAHFRRVVVRGDSDFDRADIRGACNRHGAYFAFVGRENRSQQRTRLAMEQPPERWLPYQERTERQREERGERAGSRKRKRKPDRRRERARERGYRELHQARQWVTELSYEPEAEDATYRLVIRRQLVEHRQGQVHMFDEYRYHFIVTDLPLEVTTGEVVDQTYRRCDQENLIEQLGTGVAAWRMPVAEYEGNSAWLQIARLAWNLGKWIAALALPAEASRWEWKRYRRAFVEVAAWVIKTGRRVIMRLAGSHRYASQIVAALSRLQC